MKNIRIIYNVIATLLCMVLAFFLIYPFLGNPKEKELKKMVKTYYEPHGFTGFEEYQSIRLCDEVEQQIKVMNTKLNWDKSFSAAYKGNLDGVVETTIPKDEVLSNYFHYNIEVKKDEVILKYLKKVHKLYPEKYDKVTFTIYRISYLGKNNDGEMIHDRCYGKFNTRGEMVAYKLTDTSDWVTIGETVSIPNFYEMF